MEFFEQLPLNLQFFAEEDPKDEPKEPQAEPKEPAAEPKEPDSKTSEEPKDDKSDTKSIPYERFKQVNDKAKQFEETFKELGIESTESLKELVSDYQAKKQAEEEKQREEMSELERLKADLQAKEESEKTYAQQLEDYKKQVEQERIHNAFIKVATSENVQYVDDALKLADLSAVNVSEDGKVEGMEDAIKSLVENKPYLVATKKQQKPIGESTNSDEQKNDKSADQLLKEAADKARQTGKTEDKMAYARLKRELGR